ncbi:hypothetical protein FRC08_002221 [Ceratobasidium sp. 394]|nr:hypothetical protein FRC08_002221 [Ceratobasidium sp. 394]
MRRLCLPELNQSQHPSLPSLCRRVDVRDSSPTANTSSSGCESPPSSDVHAKIPVRGVQVNQKSGTTIIFGLSRKTAFLHACDCNLVNLSASEYFANSFARYSQIGISSPAKCE